MHLHLYIMFLTPRVPNTTTGTCDLDCTVIGTCRATEEANKLSVSIQLAHDLVALLGKRADFTGVSVAVSCGRLPVTKVYNSTVWSCTY